MEQSIKVFVDGGSGTTGLRIHERLAERPELQVLTLPEEMKKDPGERRKMLNNCDIAFLCLPDDAAREAVAMIENPKVCVIDTSTAHRTEESFAYGFPELSPAFEQKITASKRIAVPGCHASGFIALVYPLIANGFLSRDALLTCHSVTGYSGGGKKMIAEYEAAEGRASLLDAPRQYGITQNHKHLKEMTAVTGLTNAPVFMPVVADFYSGMTVTVPVFSKMMLRGDAEALRAMYREIYRSQTVIYTENASENGFYSAGRLTGTDSMQISVEGNDDRILLIARYDNLGKGASGAAVECMNLVLHKNKTEGLVLA